MKIRNGIYTVYENYHLAITPIRDDENNVLLRFEGDGAPSPTFFKSQHEPGVYYLTIEKSKLTNAYQVKTFCKMGGHCLQCFSLIGDEDRINIGTNDPKTIADLQLEEGYNSYFMKVVLIRDVEKIWEERSLANFDLPLPEHLVLNKEILI